MKWLSTLLLITSILAPSTALAQDPNEPSVVIRHSEDKTFYEYRINGELKEIKVVPKIGATYYLIPEGPEADEFRRITKSNLTPPTWLIFSW
ncbi:DUF2782 domain-containing protein [Bermanella sp. R86510]|uniref:DUF2782 domain-containing protein n=1 Tax=unclassified Bermanella TaxID=2627862 RepID=UPI0037C84264